MYPLPGIHMTCPLYSFPGEGALLKAAPSAPFGVTIKQLTFEETTIAMKVKVQLASVEIPHFNFSQTSDMPISLLILVTFSKKKSTPHDLI